jgi:hypothetical protein
MRPSIEAPRRSMESDGSAMQRWPGKRGTVALRGVMQQRSALEGKTESRLEGKLIRTARIARVSTRYPAVSDLGCSKARRASRSCIS